MTTYPFKTKPFKHQLEALRRATQQGHIGLLWEPGTGKTKTMVDWTCILHMKGRATRVLIVCPLSVTGVWEDEYELHAPIPYQLHVLSPREHTYPHDRNEKGLHILVVNYDLAWRRKQIIEAFDPQVVIADESHRIKKPSAHRSRYLRSLNKVRYRAILSGTPTPKSFLDIYGQWVFLNPDRFGTNFSRFKSRYVRYGGYMNKEVRGYMNVPELKERIEQDAITKRKDECLDLPERTYQRVPVHLEGPAWEAYAKMANELFLELKDGDVSDAKNVAVKVLRLQQITGGWIKSDEGNMHQISEAKLKAAKERLEDLWNDDERVVVFARFTPEVQALRDLGVRGGVPTYVLSGDTRREDRDGFRRKFQTQDGPSVFIAQIQTGGLGITLHAAAHVLFYSVTYALDDYIQACDRVHRIGQTRNVTYQHLVASRTVDVDVYAALRRKQSIMDIVMNNPKALASSLARNLGIDTRT